MDPEHTMILFDLRPFKAACHHAISECEAGRLSPDDAADQIERLAASVPDLDEVKYRGYQSKLLRCRSHDRARRLVDCLDDHTVRPWVHLAARGLGLVAKLGALALFVWFIVWLVR
jgi:hypothetical protein